MYKQFINYLLQIKPTASGTGAVILCLLLIPLIVDIFLLAAQVNHKEDVAMTMSLPLINGYFKALPFYILYLFIFFIVTYLWTSYLKVKLSTLFRSFIKEEKD